MNRGKEARAAQEARVRLIGIILFAFALGFLLAFLVMI